MDGGASPGLVLFAKGTGNPFGSRMAETMERTIWRYTSVFGG